MNRKKFVHNLLLIPSSLSSFINQNPKTLNSHLSFDIQENFNWIETDVLMELTCIHVSDSNYL